MNYALRLNKQLICQHANGALYGVLVTFELQSGYKLH